MKKSVLFIAIAALLGFNLVNAATGSLTVNTPTFPATVEAGATLTSNITYTSDVDGIIYWNVFLTTSGTEEADWSTWKTGGSYDVTAGTDVAADYDFAIPGDFNSDDLPDGVEYILALSLSDGANDFAWNNTGNILMVTVASAAPSITINTPSFPATAEAASDFTANITYTSGVDGFLNWGIFLTTSGTEEPDWSTWKTGGDIAITAGTVTSDFNFPIPSDFNSEDLADGVEYLLALKLTDGDGTDLGAYSNTGNLLTVNPSSIVSNSIDYAVTPPSEVNQTEEVDVTIKYTVAENDTLELKVSITRYGAGYAWIDGDLVVSYLGTRSATGSTPVEETITLTVPADAVPSADLTGGEFYVFDVGIYTKSWGYINSVKSDVSLMKLETAVSSIESNAFSVYPNPVANQLSLEGVKIGTEVKVYNIAGALVKSHLVNESLTQINVSDLSKGVYFIQSDNASTKFIKK